MPQVLQEMKEVLYRLLRSDPSDASAGKYLLTLVAEGTINEQAAHQLYREAIIDVYFSDGETTQVRNSG